MSFYDDIEFSKEYLQNPKKAEGLKYGIILMQSYQWGTESTQKK